jgi:uncharacterized protein (TIGR03790 family)
MKKSFFGIIVCLLMLVVGRVNAQNISEVLLVINDNSPASAEIGNYYALKRGIPAANICHIATVDGSVPANEQIGWPQFVSDIRTPILNHIAARGLSISYIVLTKGVPPVVYGGSGNPASHLNPDGSVILGLASSDSLLAVSRDYPAEPDYVVTDEAGTHVYFKFWTNRFWNSPTRFNRATNSGFIVTRLEGWTVSAIKAMIDRSVEAAYLVGTWVHDLSPEYGLYESHPHPWALTDTDYTGLRYLDFNWDIYTSASNLIAARVPGVLRVDDAPLNGTFNGTFVENVGNIAGYIGWGSNDAARDASNNYVVTRAKWNSLGFLPGSIADIAFSGSGVSFNNRNFNNRTLIADLVDQGVSGARGNVAEPYLDAISSPTVLFAHHINGFNIGESFYSAGRFLGWREAVLGDPMTRVIVPRTHPLTEQVSAAKSVAPIGTYQ